jgi:peptidylprolyl isomerase
MMKKSEKVKGKEKVAQKKQQRIRYVIVAAIGCIIAAVILFLLFNPFVAKAGDMVEVYYTGFLADGTVFDSNLNGTPLVFTLGSHAVIAGFEDAVTGMGLNQTKIVSIPFDKAYGPYRSELVRVVNRSGLPAEMKPEVGKMYTITRTDDGSSSLVRILNVTPSTVTWDENHILAGKNLTFEIRLAGFSSGT